MRFLLFFGAVFTVGSLTIATVFALFLLLSSNGYIPNGPYNPYTVYKIGDPLKGFNKAKLAYALRNPRTCERLLELANVALLDDLVSSGDQNCEIAHRVKLNTVNDVSYRGLETRCDSALRLVAWVEYDVKLRANVLGRNLAKIDHKGSYACRNMRTSSGTAARPSLHSFAKAVDISGFHFSDGTRLRLIKDWQPTADSGWKADFLRQIRDDACDWFGGVLSPDYNDLHADHFHFDLSNRRFCR